MAKEISVYEPIGDGTKDRGEELYYFFFDKKGIRKTKGLRFKLVEEYPMSDIVRVDCYRGEDLQNDMASGAAAGLLIGGVKGAIVGGMLSSGTSKSWWIEIELKDHTVLYYRLAQESDHNAFLKWADKYGVNVEAAQIPEASAEETSTSSAEEIRKYKELLDDGIITEGEFEAKKKQLLGL